MSGTLDHVMTRIKGLEESLDRYTTHPGHEEEGHWEADIFTNIYPGLEDLHEEGAVLELTYNHSDNTYETGGAWGHIAIRVPEDELESSYRQLMDEGIEDYRDPEPCGGRYVFVKDPDGHEVEIVKHDHDAKWSPDHTMIRVGGTDETLGFWTCEFGCEHAGRWELDTFAGYFIKSEGMAGKATAVEPVYNYDDRSYEMGDVWGHPAAGADDLHDYWEALTECEAEDYRDPESCDDMFAFTEDPDDHKTEVVPVSFELPE